MHQLHASFLLGHQNGNIYIYIYIPTWVFAAWLAARPTAQDPLDATAERPGRASLVKGHLPLSRSLSSAP